MEGESTGVGRYLAGLLYGLAARNADASPQAGPSEIWRLYFKGAPFDHPLWTETAPGQPVCFEPVFDQRPNARPVLWEQVRLPKRLKADGLDAVFSPSYSLPPRLGMPSVVTIHDLSFERLPDAFPFKERLRRRYLARRACRRAARVLADTHAIADELASTYGLNRCRIGVVPLAVEPCFRPTPEPDDEVRRTALGVTSPYLLMVGTVLARRRVDLVLDAFAAAVASAPRSATEHPLTLVLVGRNRLRRPAVLEEWIDATNLRDRIVRLGYVEEASLPALYRGAEASFYLSSYEGYGLPPLESLACGTPAVVAPGLGLDDLWPDYPYRCQQLDREAVVNQTRSLIADPAGRRKCGTEGAERMASLSWREAAGKLRAEIAQVLP